MKVLTQFLSFPQDATKPSRKSSAIFNQFLSLPCKTYVDLSAWEQSWPTDIWGLLWLSTDDCLAAAFSFQFNLRCFSTSFLNNAWAVEKSDFEASQFLSCLHVIHGVNLCHQFGEEAKGTEISFVGSLCEKRLGHQDLAWTLAHHAWPRILVTSPSLSSTALPLQEQAWIKSA